MNHVSRTNKQKIVIVGGGFAGLTAAKAFSTSEALDITIIDKRNHHLFQPLLYQVAMAGLSPADIATPIRGVLSKYKNIRVIMDEIEGIDKAKNIIKGQHGQYEFDYLILACGANHSYFGKNEWEPLAPGLKTIEQATEIRKRVLLAFERAETAKNEDERKAYLTFIIVGGGPTGVEIAGALGEISRFTLSRDFRTIDPRSTRIILIEAGPDVLGSFSQESSKQARVALESLGVQIWSSSRVTEVNADGICIGKECVQAKTVIWAAGVSGEAIGKALDMPLDRQQRVYVGDDLSLHGYPHIFVIGDLAHAKGKSGQPLPGMAPVAIQQGSYVAKLIEKEVKAGPQKISRKPFSYLDKGQVATIGRNKAVCEIGPVKLSGFLAWLIWLFIHIYYLIGFRNRTFVFLQWAWHYVSYGRGARLIIGKKWQTHQSSPQRRVDDHS